MKRVSIMSFVLVASLVLASQVDGQPKAKPPATKNEKASLDEQYAKTYLDIVRLEYQQATRYNKQVNSVIPAPMIDSLRESVVVAEGWYAESQARQEGKQYNIYVPWAEALEKVAKDNYQRILKIKERAPEAIDPADVEDRRLAVELARLRVARAKALDLDSPNETMRWQIDQLREEVLRLYNQVVRLTTRE